MSDEEILQKLLEFGDYLTKGTIIQDTFRWVLWMFVKGLAWIVDALEDVADTILGLKSFYNNQDFVDFVDQFQPVFVILLAFNLLYIGYLLIFQKKFNREGVFTNLIMALMIIVVLGTGMQKADRFTDDAIQAINYSGEGGKIASQVVKSNITDIGLYDINGWDNPELEEKNNIDPEFATDININSYLQKDSDITEEENLSNDGEKILSHKVETLGDGSRKIIDLEDGSWITDITKEYYYRYTVDWINMIGTLLIMAFVLITISVKLAKLFFELAFNYVLAGIIAPTDIHNGQKMKQVVQNILNIFLVTIMIFLSMKVYMIGTGWIGENFDGIVYLIAMIGFAAAVIEGPNIVERLFGIDAGLKSGWGALAGTYAAARGAQGLAKSAGRTGGAMVNKSAGAVGGLVGVAGGLAGKQQGSGEASAGQKGGAPKSAPSHEQKNNQTAESEAESGGREAAAGVEETTTANEQAPGSIHDEMDKQDGEESASGAAGPPSLHDEMAKKGYTGAGTPPSKQGKKANDAGKPGQGGAAGQGEKSGTGSGAPTGGASEAQTSGAPASGPEQGVQRMPNAPGGAEDRGSTGTSAEHSTESGAPAAGVSGGNRPGTASSGSSSTASRSGGTETAPGTSEKGASSSSGTVSPGSSPRGAGSASSGSSGSRPAASGSSGSAPVERVTTTTKTTTAGPAAPSSGASPAPARQERRTTTRTTSSGGSSRPVSGGSSGSGTREVIHEQEQVVEERHVGHVLRDTFQNNRTVQHTRTGYQVGRNTGKAMKRNVKKQVKKFKG
ncbi:pLS20_p028 family conjugation system transmembrane protein [Halobacillus sp. BAB-2008]|uniref:pLS20_p028 family conjugation system transmembrane protein n=1 Tax=Halobacillus sp. BAB-2008 TaxID=1246484 RepID=UPI0002A4EF3D|nr:hypothetical protein [Halobacillus sp. BAB-2008]ELK47690.1 membrane spaning protein [Halobacillus sp. BAB-2008]